MAAARASYDACALVASARAGVTDLKRDDVLLLAHPFSAAASITKSCKRCTTELRVCQRNGVLLHCDCDERTLTEERRSQCQQPRGLEALPSS